MSLTKTLRTETRSGWTTKGDRLTSSEIDNNFLALDENKADKAVPATAKNLAGLVETTGQLEDSGITPAIAADQFTLAGGTGTARTLTVDESMAMSAKANVTAVNRKAASQAVVTTFAASGSTGIQVLDNANINFGTGDFTLVWRGSLPDWAPSSAVYFLSKFVTPSGPARCDFGRLTNKFYFRVEGNDYLSAANYILDNGTSNECVAVVTYGSSVKFYLNGNFLESVVIAPIDVTNAANLQVAGISTIRTAAQTSFAATYNRALTAADVLDLYINGVNEADKGASQTALTSGTLTIGKNYIIDTFVAGDDFVNVGGTNTSGTSFVATGTTPTVWTNSSSLRQAGATLALDARNAQPAPGQIMDSSGNKLHAKQPATGSSLKLDKRDFEIRWTHTWAGTHEAQYVGGFNETLLPLNAYIDSIVAVIAGATIEDIVIGDGSDVDRFVAATTAIAAGTHTLTLASRTHDGTNRKMVIDPDANFTGTIALTITGRILQ